MSALTAPSVTSPQFAARQPFERLRIVIAHNSYQQSGGEDSCVAAETAMLKAYGHHVVPYTVSNDEIHGMSRMELASRTLWSAPAYRELRALFREVRPHVAHFHNTFPLISPAAYLAARLGGAPAVAAILAGHRLAGAVIRHPGAIIPRAAMPAGILPTPSAPEPA